MNKHLTMWDYPFINLVDIFKNDMSIRGLDLDIEIWLENFCYVGIFAELFLIIFISFLIGFLVIVDYLYDYKLSLIRFAGNILIWLFILTIILLNNNSSDFFLFFDLLVVDKDRKSVV